jgi:excisionase family DNA binding protein
MSVTQRHKDGNPAAERGEDYLLTKTDLAERLRVKPRTVDNWMAAGRLPFLKVGKTVRFSWPAVKKSLLRFEVGGGGHR